MATVTFFIRASKNSETAKIRVKLSLSRSAYLYAITPFVIPVKAWNKTQQTLKQNTTGSNTISKFNYKESSIISIERAQNIIDQLKEIKQEAYDLLGLSSKEPGKEWLQATIDNYINRLNQEETQEPEPEPETLNQYITRYIDEIKSGKRLTKKNTVYAKGTVHNRISFQSEFNKFQEETGKNFDFSDITIDFYNDFVGWFNKKHYSPNTTGKHIKSLKFILSEAREENLHTNTETQRKAFKILTAEADTVYLTRAEINAIENLSNDILTQSQRVSRDVFLTGVYIAQRYSDYRRITPENLIILENGRKAIRLHQQKTGAKVVIPVTPQLEAILLKYNNRLPSTTPQAVNEDIKVICRKAGITHKIEHRTNKGAMIVTEYVEKFTLITTHTARRTGATLMYLEGLDIISIMKITGHRTEKEFKKYIRVNEEENALLLSNSDYFNKPIMNVL